VATVVRVSGSAYRRPGARMLITRDQWVAGSVSGGCVEQDVMRKGWWRTRSGAPRLVRYDARANDELGWGLGVGCDGTVDVLLEPARSHGVDPIDFIAGCYDTQQRGALATLLGGPERLGSRVAVLASGAVLSDDLDGPTREGLAAQCRRVLACGASTVAAWPSGAGPVEVLIEAVLPPARLFVVGSGHDAVPLVTMARTVGWETVVCGASARYATRERFVQADELLVLDPLELAARVDSSDRAAVVVMSHDYERDRACLSALLDTRVVYIGMLGPKRRTARMLSELGLDRPDPRVHAPVGLALGAETPQEITRDHVHRLLDARSVGTRVVASRYAGSLGVPALFTRALFGALLALRGDMGAKRLILAEEAAVAVDWPAGAMDVDTPEDAELGSRS
jgi:xanthine dehydrogenase accessory factor